MSSRSVRVRKVERRSVLTEARMPAVMWAAGVTAERVEPGHFDGTRRAPAVTFTPIWARTSETFPKESPIR